MWGYQLCIKPGISGGHGSAKRLAGLIWSLRNVTYRRII